jgi:hypothetical protein
MTGEIIAVSVQNIHRDIRRQAAVVKDIQLGWGIAAGV